MRPEPRPYERYRHFKGRDYQVLLIATDAGSGRKSVVYQGLYEPFRIYVRDMEEFLSDVDHAKYPYAQQKERFVRLDAGEADGTEKPENKDIHIDTAKDKESTGPQTQEKKEERILPKREHLSEKAEKVVLSHGAEGKSIFTKREKAEGTEDSFIRMVDPAEKQEAAKKESDAKAENTRIDTPEDPEKAAAPAVDPSLTMFLDADTVEKKLEVLLKERNKLTPKTLMLIELSLGLEVQDGSIEDRYQRIRSNLQMRQKYERHRPG